jgi:hypothetical protein
MRVDSGVHVFEWSELSVYENGVKRGAGMRDAVRILREAKLEAK